MDPAILVLIKEYIAWDDISLLDPPIDRQKIEVPEYRI